MSNQASFATLAATRRAPNYVTYSTWAVPVLMVGQFALLAAVPVTLIVIGTLRDPRIRVLRWWAFALAALYAAPLIYWLSRDDGAQSLSKDIHPAFVALVAATALVLAVKIYRGNRR